MFRLIFVFVLAFSLTSFALNLFTPQPVSSGSASIPIDISFEPVQIAIDGDYNIEMPVRGGKVNVKPVAHYKINAMVMSKAKYHFGWDSEIAPFDLALVWGELMHPKYKKYIKYRQSNRWYYFNYTDDCPVGLDYIYKHSANTHIIHANQNIYNALNRVKAGDVVGLEGYLVKVDGSVNNSSVWWNSSLTRNDRGDGACEVFYVNKVILDNNVYS